MTKRADIKTGFLCNNNCLFCVQAHKKRFGNRSTEEIFTEIKLSKSTGCDGIVFTGGEVSIREDFFDLLSFAKNLGFLSIQVQTNGRRFAYKDFAWKAIEKGMTEFAPALHGHIPELHDYLTRAKGSFLQTTQGIRNVKEAGLRVITNTVVVKPNFRYLPDLAKLFVELGVDQYQFAFVHACGNAMKNFDKMVPWVSLARPYIHEGLQIGIDAGRMVMAEAMPYCQMKGYEKYVSEIYIPDSEVRDLGSYDPDFTKTRKTVGKMKFSKCKECKYDDVCEGPWKEYPEKRGDEEFIPVKFLEK